MQLAFRILEMTKKRETNKENKFSTTQNTLSSTHRERMPRIMLFCHAQIFEYLMVT